MPKLIKSEHLNNELWKTEKQLPNAIGDAILKLGVKVLILIAKVIRDIKYNQVEMMKHTGIEMPRSTKKTTSKEGEEK